MSDTDRPLEDISTHELTKELYRRGYKATEWLKDDICLDAGYGELLDLRDPDPHHEAFSIETIATRLAREYRYSNSCRYTVAQHSVHVSEIADTHKLDALLHDAPEAVLHDLPHPAKRVCLGYQALEENLAEAVEKRHGVDLSADPVKEADMLAYNTERKSDAVPSTNIDVSAESPTSEAITPIKILPEGTAKKLFLEQYNRLTDNG